jgi:hypothetical protein
MLRLKTHETSYGNLAPAQKHKSNKIIMQLQNKKSHKEALKENYVANKHEISQVNLIGVKQA